jgi:hypothetical protein
MSKTFTIKKRKRNDKRLHKQIATRKQYNGGFRLPWRRQQGSDPPETLSSFASENQANGNAMAKGARGATKGAQLAIAALSATGIGLPLAGVLGVALLIANQMAKIVINNVQLKTVITDTLNIINHCYKINDVITLTTETFTTNLNSNTAINGDIKRIQIDPQLVSRLQETIVYLIKNLLVNATEQMLAMIEREANSNNVTSLITLVAAERAKRSGLGRLSVISRVANRTIKAGETIVDIIRDLSIIEGYFMLMKSQFDTIISHYQRELPEPEYKRIWDTISSDQKYRNYIIPNANEDIAQQAIADANTIPTTELQNASEIVDQTMKEASKEEEEEQEEAIANIEKQIEEKMQTQPKLPSQPPPPSKPYIWDPQKYAFWVPQYNAYWFPRQEIYVSKQAVDNFYNSQNARK